MICLDNTDTLEGGASVDAVVDYTVHGLVGSTFTNIAQGQLSSTDPSVLYTAGAAISIVSVVFVNTHSAAVTVNLYLDPANVGSPRRLVPKNLSLGVGYSAHFDGARLTILDVNGGIVVGVNISDTAFAASWDGVTTVAPSKNAVYDALTKENIVGLKTTDSPTFAGLIVPSISPAANFVLTQNSVAVLTSIGASAVVNTLYLKEGSLGIGTPAPFTPLELKSADPIIRLNVDGGAADNKTYEIRSIGAAGYEGLLFRAVNDANTVYDTLMFLARNGAVVIGGATPQAYYELTVNNDIYAAGDVSALTFTDRTPAYVGQNPITELMRIKALPNGELDHASLPDFVRTTVPGFCNIPIYGRNLGNMVSLLVAALQAVINKSLN